MVIDVEVCQTAETVNTQLQIEVVGNCPPIKIAAMIVRKSNLLSSAVISDLS